MIITTLCKENVQYTKLLSDRMGMVQVAQCLQLPVVNLVLFTLIGNWKPHIGC